MADNQPPFITVNIRKIRLSPVAGTLLCITLVLIAMACSFFISYPNGGDRVRINFQGVQHQLSTRVIGQRYARNRLIKSIRQSFTDVLSERSKYTLIFLVGGPGVGKHHILNIIRSNTYCALTRETSTYVKKDTLYAWDKILRLHPYMEITNNVFKCNETSISFIDVKTIDEYYIRKYENSTKLMSKFLNVITKEKSMTYIITGPIITNKTLNTIYFKFQYENYVTKVANQIRLSIPKEIADHNVYVIKFKPLEYKDFFIYLSEDKLRRRADVMEALKPIAKYNNSFIPHGCHNITYLKT